MARPGANFRVSNDQAWRRTFSFRIGVPTPAPWQVGAGTPAWAPNTTYGPSSAVTFGGDLYVAEPNLTPASWKSATTFTADADATGKPRWRRYGIASAYGRTPINLTGAKLFFAIAPANADGSLKSPKPTLTASSDDGGFVVTNALQGGVALDIASDRTSAVPAGLYAHGMYADFADQRGRQRLRFGLWQVDQGITAA